MLSVFPAATKNLFFSRIIVSVTVPPSPPIRIHKGETKTPYNPTLHLFDNHETRIFTHAIHTFRLEQDFTRH